MDNKKLEINLWASVSIMVTIPCNNTMAKCTTCRAIKWHQTPIKMSRQSRRRSAPRRQRKWRPARRRIQAHHQAHHLVNRIICQVATTNTRCRSTNTPTQITPNTCNQCRTIRISWATRERWVLEQLGKCTINISIQCTIREDSRGFLKSRHVTCKSEVVSVRWK